MHGSMYSVTEVSVVGQVPQIGSRSVAYSANEEASKLAGLVGRKRTHHRLMSWVNADALENVLFMLVTPDTSQLARDWLKA
jgi:hypothetical protein